MNLELFNICGHSEGKGVKLTHRDWEFSIQLSKEVDSI